MPKSIYAPAPAGTDGLESAPPEEIKRTFARNLQATRLEKGWSQSDLARRAFGDGKSAKGRDNISGYERALRLPTPTLLRKLCDALGVTEGELLPTAPRSKLETDSPSFGIRSSAGGDSKVWLTVNQAVSWDKAVKIMQVLKDADD